jgi:hypothetical protein
MNRVFILTILLVAFFSSLDVKAQVNSADIEKSVVRIEVSDPKRIVTEANVCTGILWKSEDQIVTSLHAMHPGWNITVKYFGEFPRPAEVVRVLKEADLVLLRLIPPAKAPEGAKAFTSYHSEQLAEHSVIISLGYNRGAPKPSTQEMKKGYTPNEILAEFIPNDDYEDIKAAGMPSVNLDIIFCIGSLQPGYSGAPAYDLQGRLVGIGDGGLEQGANNVSWIIPAKYLTALEKSPVTKLPENLPDIAQHFSARVRLEIASPEDTEHYEVYEDEEGYYDYASLVYEDYDEVYTEDFIFRSTKTRSLLDMKNSANDPDRLMSIAQFVEGYNVDLDYDFLTFEIYEDVNYGVLLAIPEGEYFYYDADKGHLQVDYSDDLNFDLFYLGGTQDNSDLDFEQLIDEVIEVVPPYVQETWAVETFTVNYDFSEWRELDYDRKIAKILMVSEDFYDEEFGGISNVFLYMTVLVSYDKYFISVASFCMSNAKLDYALENGVDCVYDFTDDCTYFENMIKVFGAAHLTNFAY